MNDKFTLRSFLEKYKTNDACLEEIKNMRWSNGITCKKCNKVTSHYKITGRMQYACSMCGTHVAPLAGTIFEKSTTPLTDWFYAMFLMINTRCGIPAKQLQRELGVTYKTAWRMAKQIRILMADMDGGVLDGVVEVDETYVGGKPRLREFGEGVKDKEVVMGMVKRGGKVYLKHVEGSGKWHLIEQIQHKIDPKARIITDEYPSYRSLGKMGWQHESVNHGGYVYVKGDIHTQNIENVWSHLKRGIHGVYRHVSKKYLQAYADEFAFRYNHRKSGDMFMELLKQIPSIRTIETSPLLIKAA